MKARENVLILILQQIIFYALLLGLWQLLYTMKFWPEYLFPSPGQVWASFEAGLRDKTLLVSLAISLRRLVWGYGISVVMGTLLGLVIGKVRVLDQTLGKFFSALQTLPSICWLPLAVLWFGLQESAITFVIVMGSFFAITIATDAGVKNIQPIILKAGRNMGAKGFDMFWQVTFPAAMPSILMGYKQGWSFAWRSLMAGEILFVSLGLGHLLNMGRELNDMSQVIAVMGVIIAVGVAMEFLIFGFMEKKVRVLWGLESH